MAVLRLLHSVSVAVALAFALSGCSTFRASTVPLRSIELPANCSAGGRPDTLLVLLPGSSSLPEEFQEQGFVRAIRQHGLAADIVLVGAHPDSYFDRTIVDRLRTDVVAPALARGVRHVWLVGISIGGLGTMLYAEARPADVAGIVAIAPYLGARLSAKDIVNAGGLARWRAPPFAIGTDLDAGLWRWLQRQTSQGAQTSTTPGSDLKIPLFLGYGLSDRFAYSARVLDAALPRERVFTADGGHDWPVWNALWERMVAALPVERRAACSG